MIPSWAYWTASFLDVNLFYRHPGSQCSRRIGAGPARNVRWKPHARNRHASRASCSNRAWPRCRRRSSRNFLFDSLVDVQATYDRDADRGADVMDRLITYLRVALAAVARIGFDRAGRSHLLAAYLAVVAAAPRRIPGGAFYARTRVRDRALFRRCLLLPLVQRAMRGVGNEGKVPRSVELVVRARATTWSRSCVSRRPACAPTMPNWRACVTAWQGCTMAAHAVPAKSRNPE